MHYVSGPLTTVYEYGFNVLHWNGRTPWKPVCVAGMILCFFSFYVVLTKSGRP